MKTTRPIIRKGAGLREAGGGNTGEELFLVYEAIYRRNVCRKRTEVQKAKSTDIQAVRCSRMHRGESIYSMSR